MWKGGGAHAPITLEYLCMCIYLEKLIYFILCTQTKESGLGAHWVQPLLPLIVARD